MRRKKARDGGGYHALDLMLELGGGSGLAARVPGCLQEAWRGNRTEPWPILLHPATTVSRASERYELRLSQSKYINRARGAVVSVSPSQQRKSFTSFARSKGEGQEFNSPLVHISLF